MIAGKLRLLYIPSHFPPSASAGVHRVMRVCRYLPQDQFEIDVLARNLEEDPGGQELMLKIPESVHVRRVSLRGQVQLTAGPEHKTNLVEMDSRSRSNFFEKAWLPLRAVLKNAKQLLTETPDKHVEWVRPLTEQGRIMCDRNRYDLIMTSGPPHSIHLVGIQLSKQFQTPLVADFRDPLARRPWTVHHNPWGQHLLPRYERQIVKSAAKVLLNTQATWSDFKNAYPQEPEDKFHWVPNGLDPELPAVVREIAKDSGSNGFSSSEQSITLCHAGTLYGNRRPDGLLQAIALLKKKGVTARLIQIGLVDGSVKFQSMLAELGIADQVDCIGTIAHSEVLRIMTQVDLHVVLQPDGPFMIPGKVYEMIAFPQPIVAICDSPVTVEVVESAGGSHASSRDPVAISEAILAAIKMKDDEAFRSKRIEARKVFDGQEIVKRLGTLLQEVASARGLRGQR